MKLYYVLNSTDFRLDLNHKHLWYDRVSNHLTYSDEYYDELNELDDNHVLDFWFYKIHDREAYECLVENTDIRFLVTKNV